MQDVRIEKKPDNSGDKGKEVRMEMATAGNTVVVAKYAIQGDETCATVVSGPRPLAVLVGPKRGGSLSRLAPGLRNVLSRGLVSS